MENSISVDAIGKDINNRMKNYTHSMCATDDEVSIAYLLCEIDSLREALVYVAHASHNTPLHMLPKGVMLGVNNFVEVKLNAGVTVTAKYGT